MTNSVTFRCFGCDMVRENQTWMQAFWKSRAHNRKTGHVTSIKREAALPAPPPPVLRPQVHLHVTRRRKQIILRRVRV